MISTMRLPFFIVFIGVFFYLGCETPKPPIKLSNEDFHVVDSLVKLEKKLIQTEIDSICNYYSSDYYDHIVDSLMLVRRADIRKIINE